MKKEKLDLSQWKNVKLLFKGNEHNFSQVIIGAAGGPLIRVEIKDLANVAVSDVPNNDVLLDPHSADTSKLSPILYKHGGKFYLLAGQEALAKAKAKEEVILEGHLISTVAFKNCRIVKPEPAAPDEPTAIRQAFAAPTRSYPPRTTTGTGNRRDRYGS